MFIGSFYRVQTKNDIDHKVPFGSSPAIIYVEDSKEFYERNIYGLICEYPIGLQKGDILNTIDYTDEITDMEKRIHDLEESIKNINNILGGKIHEI